MVTFGDIFSATWKEYKTNFRSIFNFMFIFRGIPLILFNIITLFWIYSNVKVYNFIAREITEDIKIPWDYFIASLIFGFIMILLLIFISGAITSLSLKKAKFTSKELATEGKSVYFRYLSYSIVYTIFVFLLLLLLIIPGIIFGIYWVFGAYILFDQKTTIRKALKNSRYLVRGRWWRVFGYSLLMMLIYLGISLLTGLISLPTQLMQINNSLTDVPPSMTFLTISFILSTTGGFISELLGLPLMILFLKNFYLNLKKNQKSKK